ncbi:hypothetical protein B5K06_31440 [Rhizobium grahamii]|uniref:Uncharacterized protein n=1 Tax=Rhizobium grahamii TaxID=1120045 RepID=A0A370KF91_9HYPH|nr:hypothetical protein B5K06_31440 [Rhizobium grahamii]
MMTHPARIKSTIVAAYQAIVLMRRRTIILASGGLAGDCEDVDRCCDMGAAFEQKWAEAKNVPLRLVRP